MAFSYGRMFLSFLNFSGRDTRRNVSSACEGRDQGQGRLVCTDRILSDTQVRLEMNGSRAVV